MSFWTSDSAPRMVSTYSFVDFPHICSASSRTKHLRYRRENPLLLMTSPINTKCDNCTFSLWEALWSFGSVPFLWWEMIGAIQSAPVGITCISILSVVGEYWTKNNTWLLMIMCFANATLARQSASLFSSLGIYLNLVKNFWFTLSLTMLRYSFIRSLLAL